MSGCCGNIPAGIGIAEDAGFESVRTRFIDLDRVQDVFKEHHKTQCGASGVSESEVQNTASFQGHETEPDGKGIQTLCVSAVRQDRTCAAGSRPHYRDMQTVRKIL